MKTFHALSIPIVAAALMWPALSAAADLDVKLGEISDKRTTGEFFKGLEIELKVSGKALAGAKSIKVGAFKAVDDTGKELKPQEGFGFSDEFEAVDADAEEQEIKLNFENPPRSAKALKSVTGEVLLLNPAKDPSSIVTASLTKDAGKALDHPALKQAKVSFTIKAAEPAKTGKKAASQGGLFFGGGDNDIVLQIKDPDGKLAAIEFQDAQGQSIETSGRSRMSSGDNQTWSYSMEDKAPAGAVVKIYLLTEKSAVRVPVSLSNIPLP
jgi:hypothetical protein